MPIVRFFMSDAFDKAKTMNVLSSLQLNTKSIVKLETEKCYHVEIEEGCSLTAEAESLLRWILKNPQNEDNLSRASKLASGKNQILIEVGPRFNFSTAASTNSVSICHNIELNYIRRIEVSIKYLITFSELDETSVNALTPGLLDILSDRMTQCRYTDDNMPRDSFDEQLPKIEDSWFSIPILEEGRESIEAVNVKLGLAFDNWDLDYYTNLFVNVLKRNPTSVELFDCAQSNSEHSRHWFFKGRMILDGVEQTKSLIQLIIDTQNYSNPNNTIKFSDNSSAIRGYTHKMLKPTDATKPNHVEVVTMESDLIFTAETHNMPTAVAPFSGATTGTGGRIRDVQGVGRGGFTIAGTAGYCVGNLNIPSYQLNYENDSFEYPPSFEKPLKILIEASNGASDYGNKFGEPLIAGFAISYGLMSSVNVRDEYVKPIMFSGGIGTMDSKQTNKIDPVKGMLLAKIGGPVYRIGVGGGAASSVEIQGDTNNAALDFNAVQRGDAEMENKLNRVVRACIEMGDSNPILAIHDQGAGGNGNVLKELVEPKFAGAIIFSKEFQLGDPTITALELWGAEYQENNAILCRMEHKTLLENICKRERCPINFVGIVSGNGFVSLIESEANLEAAQKYINREFSEKLPFDMHLKDVLGEMPRKVFNLQTLPSQFAPLNMPSADTNFSDIVKNVLSIVAVGSKRFLTNKVDRCVTGLIAQQQCVGPLHTPLADFAITAVSHFGFEGIASSIGTQPIKGLISPIAGARMSVAEALSNLVFAGISELSDVKCSGNWMWAAKLQGEGAKMYTACQEMCQIMKELGIAVDGGKDSLSMAARVKNDTIKSPGTLVISTYAPCPDVRVKVTPDLKSPAVNQRGELIWINIEGKFRLGGSAFAQSISQQGDNSPNLEQTDILKNAFNCTQKLLKNNDLLAGHDISDGGLIVCLIEMAIAGMCGIEINLKKFEYEPFSLLFSEECGWVIEVSSDNLINVLSHFKNYNVPAHHIGHTTTFGLQSKIIIECNDKVFYDMDTLTVLKQWERTSFELEKLQMNRNSAIEEFSTYEYRTGPQYICTYKPDAEFIMKTVTGPIKVACIREEGSNGDRELMAALFKANFEVHDVTMYDLINSKTTLNAYRGVVFPGGFSYADTLGSAKGWAASIMGNKLIAPQFRAFKVRPDTFSIGVCNGCQLMSLIGWVGEPDEQTDNNLNKIVDVPNVALLHNNSERYECRWSTVKIAPSKSIMFNGMVGSVLGCWIAHGEGRFSFKTTEVLQKLKENNCVALYYVDDNQLPTETYPMNPNGSTEGIAGICSEDGRHLALMPHPERCSEMWQWPYVPDNFSQFKKSPWQKMFENAYSWCIGNEKN